MTTTIVTNSFIDSILPTYRNPRKNTPVWNESMHMFIINEHESAAGNRSYDGVRFADRFIIIEHIGHYHSFTYINGVDMYAFNGKERVLIGKKPMSEYYDTEKVRTVTEELLKDYIASQLKIAQNSMPADILEKQVKTLVDGSYQSMYNEDTSRYMESIQPLLLH